MGFVGYYFCPYNSGDNCTIGINGPEGVSYNISSTAFNSGEEKNVSLVPPAGVLSKAGAEVSGYLWVCWTNSTYLTPSCTSGSNTVNFVQIATLTAKSE